MELIGILLVVYCIASKIKNILKQDQISLLTKNALIAAALAVFFKPKTYQKI